MKGRLKLAGYHKDVIREALSRGEDGHYKYSIIVWSDIKKSIKSTIAAAINLYGTEFSEWGERLIVANDLKQADSRVSYYIRRAIELNPKLRDKYHTNGYRISAPNNSFMEAIPIDPSGEAGSNADMITFSELWGAKDAEKAKQNMWCLDDKSEVLTRQGWKMGVDLTVFDEVAAYCDGHVSWEKPAHVFCQNYSGNMHVYEHKNFSLVCTPDHRLHGRYSYKGDKEGKNKYDKLGVMRSQELRASGYSYYHPEVKAKSVDRSNIQPDGIHLPRTKFHTEFFIAWKDWASFLGLYLTEGHTSDFRGVPVHVNISQDENAHPEQYAEIEGILTRIFGGWAKRKGMDGWKISSTELAKITKKYGTTWFKRIPREIIESNNDVLRIFLHSYILGDGHTVKDSESVQITCASKGMADDLQEVCFRLGLRSSVRPHDKKYWRVLIANGSFSVSVHKDSWSEVSYNGKVWCPTVSTGLFVARREGRVFVTGNSEMTLSPTKFGESFRWVETYAGTTGEAKLLYSLYETGVKRGRLLWPDRLYPVTGGEPSVLELYVNESARMLCLWNTQPRCSWQSKAYYASESGVLLPNQFARMHRNQWASGADNFIPMEWWWACKHSNDDWPAFEKKKHPMIIALDAGVSSDNFGVIMGGRHPENKDETIIEFSRKWVPPVGGKIDFQGTPENPGPELVVEQLIKDYNVVQVAYDPYQLHDMATRQKKKGLAWWRAFNQAGERLEADNQYRTKIKEKRVWHRGEKDLEEHMENADGQQDDEDRKVRIVKRAEELKVDLTVAGSMMNHEVHRLNL